MSTIQSIKTTMKIYDIETPLEWIDVLTLSQNIYTSERIVTYGIVLFGEYVFEQNKEFLTNILNQVPEHTIESSIVIRNAIQKHNSLFGEF